MKAVFDSYHAIILKERQFAEYDAVFIVMTKERGKQSILARGIKKQNSRLRSSMQLFNESYLDIVSGKNMPLLTGAEVLSSHETIRASYVHTMVALYYMDVFDRLVEEGAEEPGLFSFLSSSLNELPSLSPRIALYRFEWQFLFQLGYQTDFEYCSNCAEPIKRGNKFGYADREGGFYCPSCQSIAGQSKGFSIGNEEIVFLEALNKFPVERIKHLYLSQPAKTKINQYLTQRYETLLSAPLKSRAMLKTLL